MICYPEKTRCVCPIGLRILISAAISLFLAGCSHQRTNVYQGYVEGKYVYVASPQSGRLTNLWVARGASINQGQRLFQLENEPEAAVEREAESALRASEARLADLRTGRRPPEVDATRAQLAQAEAESRKAAEILKSSEEQYKAGGISLTDLINARGAAESEAAVVQQLENEVTVARLPAREQQLRAQVAQVEADRAILKQADWKLQQKRIISPRDGFVFDTIYREGEWVPAGNAVIELLPPEKCGVAFFVPERDLGRIKLGQRLAVTCDGCAPKTAASITFLSPQSEYTPPVIYSNENRSKLVFMIIAKPPVNRAIELHPGQPVEVGLE